MTDNCPNHDDTQICPDCAFKPPSAFRPIKIVGTITGRMPTVSPLDQHKADLEMILAATMSTPDGKPATRVAVRALVKALLDRLPKS
jgi:hypothetical protein